MTDWFDNLPAGWEVSRLKNIIEGTQTGVWGDDPRGDDDDIRCVRVADFDRPRSTVGSVDTFRSVTQKDREGRLLELGDILLEKSGGTDNNPVGFSVMFSGTYPAVSSNFITRLRMKRTQLPRFWLYALDASYATKRTERSVRRTTGIQNLDLKAFFNDVFPVPPLAEQSAIADYLDRETARIDTLIDEQDRLVVLLRERRAAGIDSALSAAPTVGTGQRLKHLVTEVRQGWSPQCYPWPADGVTTWAVLKAGAANWGVFRPDENKELPSSEIPRPEAVVRRGQLVVSRANTRELAGSAAVVKGDYPRLMLSDKLYGFSLDADKAVPTYVASVLGTRRLRGLIELEASGSSPSMQNISQADILNLPMDLPDVDEQHRIVAHLEEQTGRIDSLIAETERFIDLARERRAALITAAVTGQIDVRNEVA